jgi:hypothetical protein
MLEQIVGKVSRIALVAAAALGMAASAAAGTVYWVAPRSNAILDRQVTSVLGASADAIVIRATWMHPDPNYTLAAIVGRFKASGNAKVLAYGWGNRYADSGRGEVDLFRGLDVGKPILERDEPGIGRVAFLDVTDAALRSRIVDRFVEAKSKLGVDGFALDLSHRTPTRGPLSRRCAIDIKLCPNYAKGMDALFADLRGGLGANSFIAYNGLFNFTPGQLADQARLLSSTDAAAIEYFGRNPGEPGYAFTKDILPYLRAVHDLPKDRAVWFFGRGSWQYSDYVDDYRWQRYLFASFLLAARELDLFKYHSSFQIPAHEGRSGGMDRYADWSVRLGKAKGTMTLHDGLFVREFASGLVAVAPDDGPGAALRLTRPRFTPEGARLEGTVRLPAGTGLVLLDQSPDSAQRPARRVISATDMAGWKWPNAALMTRSGAPWLELQPLPPERAGEHDLMLDSERTLSPYGRLEIRLGPLSPPSRVLLVAEVDDREKKHDTLVIEVAAREDRNVRFDDAAPFRTVFPKGRTQQWPRLSVARAQGDEVLAVDGPHVLEGSRFRFRRWSHIRFDGPVAVAEVTLSRPRQPLSLESAR